MMIVCDIGTNWLGSMALAKEMITRICDIGCIPKMQIWKASELYKELKNSTLYDIMVRCELDLERAISLFRFNKKLFFSAFNTKDFLSLYANGLRVFKIAYRSFCEKEIVDCVLGFKDAKKIISLDIDYKGKISDEAASEFDYRVYCIPEYPANTQALIKICDFVPDSLFFNGVSLHTTSKLVLEKAIENEIDYIEVHCTLDRTLTACTPDNVVSFTLKEIEEVLCEHGKL